MTDPTIIAACNEAVKILLDAVNNASPNIDIIDAVDLQKDAIDAIRKSPNMVQEAFPDKILVDRAQYERMRVFVRRTIQLIPCPNWGTGEADEFTEKMWDVCHTYARG